MKKYIAASLASLITFSAAGLAAAQTSAPIPPAPASAPIVAPATTQNTAPTAKPMKDAEKKIQSLRAEMKAKIEAIRTDYEGQIKAIRDAAKAERDRGEGDRKGKMEAKRGEMQQRADVKRVELGKRPTERKDKMDAKKAAGTSGAVTPPAPSALIAPAPAAGTAQ